MAASSTLGLQQQLTPNINDVLPRDIFYHIFTLIGEPGTLSSVCKLWRQFHDSDRFYIQLLNRYCNEPLLARFKDGIPRKGVQAKECVNAIYQSVRDLVIKYDLFPNRKVDPKVKSYLEIIPTMKMVQQIDEDLITLVQEVPWKLCKVPVALYDSSQASYLRANAIRSWMASKPKGLDSISELKLARSKLHTVPAEIRFFTALVTLDLHENPFKDVPGRIGQLAQLKKLSLGNNRVTHIPEGIFDLTDLEYLNLRGNYITVLPKRIGRLTKMKILIIAANPLTELPDEIMNLRSLEKLVLGHDKLTSFPEDIECLGNLTELDLSNNPLTELPQKINKLEKLKELYLQGTRLTKVPKQFDKLVSLELLCLGDSKIKEFPDSLCKLVSLKSMSLDNLGLGGLDESIGRLVNLESLDIAGNNITTLPSSIVYLNKLKTLTHTNNPLGEFTPEISSFFKEHHVKLIDHNAHKYAS